MGTGVYKVRGTKNKTTRRGFLGALAAGFGGSVLGVAPAVHAAQKFRLKLATTWSPKMPILQDSAELFAKRLKEATDGELSLKVFAAGELIPAFGVFDAVSQGTIDMGIGSPYYWAGKSPAVQWFASLPFGMSAQQFNAWLISGGGQKLWEEVYAQFNLVPLSIGNTGSQMGGWFKRQIRSVEDVRGLKIRIPGFGGKVYARAGANVVLISGGEVYTALERGTIDAAEWIGPFHDERLGLYRAAKNYYYPGWHEPGTNLELTINQAVWQKLPKRLHVVVRAVAAEVGVWCLHEFEAQNGPALERLKKQYRVSLRAFPSDFLKSMKKHSKDVIEELANSDAVSRKIYQSYQTFEKNIQPWSKVGEQA